MAKQDKAILEVEVRGETYEFKRPTTKVWTRYSEKLRRGEMLVAQRELVHRCCVSHEPEEVGAMLDKAPAVVSQLSVHLVTSACGDLECETTDDYSVVATLDGATFTLRGPDMAEWEDFQRKGDDKTTRLHEEVVNTLKTLCDDAEDLAAKLSLYPAAAMVIFEAIGEIAGRDIEVVVKKG